MKILTLIPARSGSKGIKDKNIRLLNKKPLIQYSIEQALKSKYVKQMKIVTSTDSEHYRNLAIQLGSEAPFLRPKEISQDLSTDLEFVQHALKYLRDSEKYVPDIVLQLRPTQPLRKVEDIDKCLDIFIKNLKEFDSIRSVKQVEKSPYKMYSISGEELTPLFYEINGIKEPFNECRQNLPETYLHIGYIDIFKSSIVSENTLSGNKVLPYIIEDEVVVDIDTEEDFRRAEKILISKKN